MHFMYHFAMQRFRASVRSSTRQFSKQNVWNCNGTTFMNPTNAKSLYGTVACRIQSRVKWCSISLLCLCIGLPSKARFFSKTSNLCLYALKKFPPQYVPIYKKALQHLDRTAVIDSTGRHSYFDILRQSWILSQKITELLPENKKNGTQKQISFLCDNDVNYIIVQWACWMSKNVAVPLSKFHPMQQLEYFVRDSQSSIVITTEEFVDKIKPLTSDLSIPLLIFNREDIEAISLNELKDGLSDIDFQKVQHEHNRVKGQPAMILYTSGTTSLPKGVVLTHCNLNAQISALVMAWEFTHLDVVLQMLPLHHLHGILNAMLCPLSVGGCCYMLTKFDAVEVWKCILNEEKVISSPNILMGVPTMYAKLVEEHIKNFPEEQYPLTQRFIRATCLQNIRFMACGSAPLPTPLMEKWEKITGHKLLGRYGMTELGMVLSNPLHGKRTADSVGSPMPGVQVRIAKLNVYSPNGYDTIVEGNEHQTVVMDDLQNESGELLVKGSNVFSHYWNNPQANEQAFTRDGWFKTGDTAKFSSSEEVYYLLGRTSVDIIKSGGYKISALEVERHLRGHDNIKDCAVVGLPDITWGEKVAAVIVTGDSASMTLPTLQAWCEEFMPSYIIPSVLVCVPELPRNAMGKINKKDLMGKVFPEVKRFWE